MSLGQKLYSVFRAEFSGLVGWRYKLSSFILKRISIRVYNYVPSKSLLVKDMLSRAAKEFEPRPLNSEGQKRLFFSSSPLQDGNIDEQLRKARKLSKLNHVAKNYMNALQTKRLGSPIAELNQKNSQPIISTPIVRSISTSTSQFSTSSKKISLHSRLDLNKMEKKDIAGPSITNSIVNFNEDDFDEDDDLDLENDLPKLKTEKLNDIQTSILSPPKLNAFKSQGNWLNLTQDRPSSTMTWSSSSPSHKLPPLLSDQNIKRETEDITNEFSSEPIRPPKRRTLPWLQRQAEDNLVASKENVREKKGGPVSKHTAQADGTNEAGTPTSPIPLSDKYTDISMPWNTTGNAIKEEKKKLKEKHKHSKKNGELVELEKRHEYLQSKNSIIPLSLSEEQKKVLDLVLNHSKSVFFTGSAGTGKSVLMRAIITELRKKYCREPDRVAVTASTGLAACNIGGVTLHSFGGIGLGKDDVPALVRKVRRNPKAKLRWIKTKILIIDEISMVDGELFDKLEGIARAIRNNGRPFGGIQLVITGDFFQLPPVPEFDSRNRNIKFAFDAGTWSTSIHHTIGLTQVFRQKDSNFANMLNEMRLGKVTEETVMAFKSLNRSVAGDGMEATELFPTRREVENANAFRMRNLKGSVHKYEARDNGTLEGEFREKLLANMMAPKLLELKIGAQVMLIKNMDDGLVNGSIGKVKGFMSERDFKLFGDTPDGLEQLENSSEEDTNDENSNSNGLKLSQKYASTDTTSEMDSGKLYPFVSFKLSDGTRRMMLILPESWKVELPNGEVQAERTQVPLILAWALSIHKAQGQTLPRVKIDLKKIFEKGQAYVALSRATTQAGLQVLNFDKHKVLAHPRVAHFYNNLYDVSRPSN